MVKKLFVDCSNNEKQAIENFIFAITHAFNSEKLKIKKNFKRPALVSLNTSVHIMQNKSAIIPSKTFKQSIHELSALEIAHLFKDGILTAEFIAEYFLIRIKKLDNTIHSFIEVYEDRVIQKARLLDNKFKNKNKIGLLSAVPIALKDNINVEGHTTTFASKHYKNFIAPCNAYITDLLEKEDALIIGKTNMDEMAVGSSGKTSCFIPSINPWNFELSTGGSSSGSAAAVAARLVPISIGTDMGGSIRQPSAFCSIIGFKPSFKRVSLERVETLSSLLDNIGPIASNMDDIALAMQVLVNHDKQKNDKYLNSINKGINNWSVGTSYKLLDDVDPIIKESFLKSLQKLQSLGFVLYDIDLSFFNKLTNTYLILSSTEAFLNFKKSQLKETNGLCIKNFGLEFKKRIFLGQYLYEIRNENNYIEKALKIRKYLIKRFASIFSKFQILVLPSTPCVVPSIDKKESLYSGKSSDLFLICANLAGLPSITLPSGFDIMGKPFSIQILANKFQDNNILRAAKAFEEILGKSPVPKLDFMQKNYFHDYTVLE